MSMIKTTLADLSKKVQAKLIGDPACEITGISTLQSARKGDISFLDNPKYKPYLSTTKASAVILSEADLSDCPCYALVVPNPYFSYAMIARAFDSTPKLPQGIHPTAIIGENCRISHRAAIGAHVVVGDHVVIGENTQIWHGCVIGDHVQIGSDCLLWAQVTLYYQVQVGDRVIIHSGAVVGSDGFGIARHQDCWYKIPQLGTVVISDDVEIGASTTIDRGALDNTVLGKGVKLDNQIQIGHNCQIGENTVVAGCAGIAGSTKIGKNCMIGAAAGIVGHLEIADRVMVAASGTISKSISEPGGLYASGTGPFKHRDWQRLVGRLRHLDKLAKRVIALEKTLGITQSGGDSDD